MPEGDTIYRLASRLDAAVGGREIVAWQTTEPQLQRDDLVGRRIERARASGKNLFIDLSGGLSLHSHLQMLGKWFVETPPRTTSLDQCGATVHGEYRPAQLRLSTEIASILAKNLRILRWLPTGNTATVTMSLGPDLLSARFDEVVALANLRAQDNMAIGIALMRQDLVAGVGNVYKSETLFLQGMHPLDPVAAFKDEELLDLLRLNRKLLQRNVGKGPRRTRFSAGGPRLWIYERSGQRCGKCGTLVEMIRLGPKLRSSYLCPSCQPRRT